jgi:FixJ family two-component response regulator
MSGQALAEQVVALRPGIEVVFMSGYPLAKLGMSSEHGMFAPSAFFLQKPFELAHILRQVFGPGNQT